MISKLFNYFKGYRFIWIKFVIIIYKRSSFFVFIDLD